MLSSPEFWLFCGVGFVAQLIDGALGMAYGVTCIAMLSATGVSAVSASAMVHVAEVFTTCASGASHVAHRNIDWRLFARLAPAGVAGGVLGAYLLVGASGEIVGLLVAAYLSVVALLLLRRALRSAQEMRPAHLNWALPLGGIGGHLDSWGGGWGPVVASTLMGNGHVPRMVIGTVSLSEFVVSFAISAAFVTALLSGELPGNVREYARELVGLVVGGLVAAPLAGYVARLLPTRHLTLAVGLLVLGLAGWQVVRSLRSF